MNLHDYIEKKRKQSVLININYVHEITLTPPSRIVGCELATDDGIDEFKYHFSIGNPFKFRNNRNVKTNQITPRTRQIATSIE